MSKKFQVKDELEKKVLPLHQAIFIAKDLLEAKGMSPKASRLFKESIQELIEMVHDGKFPELDQIFTSYEQRVFSISDYLFDNVKQRNFFGTRLINHFYICMGKTEVVPQVKTTLS